MWFTKNDDIKSVEVKLARLEDNIKLAQKKLDEIGEKIETRGDWVAEHELDSFKSRSEQHVRELSRLLHKVRASEESLDDRVRISIEYATTRIEDGLTNNAQSTLLGLIIEPEVIKALVKELNKYQVGV